MNLRGNGVATFGHALNIAESFNDVHLPEREAHVQRSRVVTRHVPAELAPVAWLRQAAVSNMIFNIEMFVVHPVREVELKRNADKPAAERRVHVQPSTDMLQNIFESNRPFSTPRRVKDGDRCHMCRALVRLQV